ncbi:MAG: hypothetical protein FWC41_14275, partial [Firmicutes bacterium]|nr:hypothetical protein [Bacillota bacterium]
IDLEDAKKEIDTLNKDIEKLIVEKNELLKKVSNYKALQESNKELEKKLHESKSYKPQIEALNETVTNLKLKLKEHETNDKNIDQMERLYKATLEKVTKQQDEIIKELNQQFHNQTKKNNDEFNEKIEKYLLVNIRQNEALKQIIDLSFFDLIRNKHKKVANKNIEKIDSPIYELTPKK